MSTVMFSSPSYSEWTKVSTNVMGDTFYVDFDRIRKNSGYAYFWKMSDYMTPNSYGDFSGILYYQSECGVLRWKVLSDSYFKGQMGTGEKTGGSNKPDKEWSYPSPNSSSEKVLKTVCGK